MYSLHQDLTKQKIKSEKLAFLFKKSDVLSVSGIKIEHCCDTVSFRFSCDGEPEINNVFFCREKYCPTCQRRKSLKAYAEGMRLAARLADSFAFLHLVLTVRNCDGAELRHTIQHMNTACSKLLRGGLCKSPFKGVLRCLEITVNTVNNTFHPHFHCLVAVKKSYFTSRYYVRHADLSAAWAYLVGQPSAMIHISRVTDPRSAIAEVCKYCTKPFDLDCGSGALAFYETLYKQTKGLRHIQSYGVIREALRELKIDFERLKVDFTGDDLDFSDFEDIGDIFGGGDIVYRWNAERGKYILEE